MKTNNIVKSLLKASVLMGTAGLMMGNQSCQQQPVATSRQLKRIVEMGKIVSPAIMLPEGGTFDFEYVANQQIYAVLQNSEHFALRYKPPVVTVPTAFSSEAKALSVSRRDTMMVKALLPQAKESDPVQYSKEAACMINLPTAKIQGSVNAFELIGGAGVKIGFDPTGAHNPAGLSNVGLNIQWAQLDLSLMATSPLTGKQLAAANVTSKQTKTNVNFTLNLGGLAVGPSAYYQTPLASVTKKGLTTGVTDIYNSLSANPNQQWYTRVLVNHDTHLAIVGGADVNLRVGDRLNIYNDEYYWQGEPCAPGSTYYGGGAKDPVAVIEIDWVGDEVSRGRVIKQTDENPVPGARVTLSKLAEDVAAEAAAAAANTPAKK